VRASHVERWATRPQRDLLNDRAVLIEITNDCAFDADPRQVHGPEFLANDRVGALDRRVGKRREQEPTSGSPPCETTRLDKNIRDIRIAVSITDKEEGAALEITAEPLGDERALYEKVLIVFPGEDKFVGSGAADATMGLDYLNGVPVG
jgi:hypothetical protein